MENKPYPKTGQNQNLLAIFDEIPADRQALIPEEDTDFCRQLQTQFDNVHDALGKKYDEVRFEAQLLQDYSNTFRSVLVSAVREYRQNRIFARCCLQATLHDDYRLFQS